MSERFKISMGLALFLLLIGHSWGQGPLLPYRFGDLVIMQGASSDSSTSFNVVVPRLKAESYVAIAYPQGSEAPRSLEELDPTIHHLAKQTVTVREPQDLTHKVVNKYFFDDLKPQVNYLLGVFENRRGLTLVDEREFSTLAVEGDQLTFVLGSCMTEDPRYRHIREVIWGEILKVNPELIVLTGDLVYVDGFEFVAREKASALDLWQRYLDATEKIPFYHSRRLIPTVATWDDHDMVTNDSNANTRNKEEALRVFEAFFGSEDIPGVYQKAGLGVASSYRLRGQQLILMDGRFFREEAIFADQDGSVLNADQDYTLEYRDPETGYRKIKTFPQLSPYAHWGKTQHQWMLQQIDQSPRPTWIFNGDQIFGEVSKQKRQGRNGEYVKRLNESLMSDRQAHFQQLLSDLKKRSNTPVVFGSGDIHFSELMQIESEALGYTTYEITSSPIHSFIFGDFGTEGLWDNPRRLAAYKAHNFVVVTSQALSPQRLRLDFKSVGPQGEEFFSASNLMVEASAE